MTTAHRPTFNPAIASEIQGGVLRFGANKTLSSKDQTAHTKLKLRQDGQNSAGDLETRDLRAELEERERAARIKGTTFSLHLEPPRPPLLRALSAVPNCVKSHCSRFLVHTYSWWVVIRSVCRCGHHRVIRGSGGDSAQGH